ncbi:MAG: hypothetical protein DCC73_12215 [Proteobacteria bacterium]|nr:MAG: hypothetical protein DCC73_12215 [Pseudomonadota bacterium]
MIKRLLWPSLITLAAFALLTFLGLWQLERLQWKRALLADIHAGLSAPAAALPDEIVDPTSWNYRRVIVEGRFDHRSELYLNAIGPEGAPGYHVLTPLLRGEAMPVLINRGWIPLNAKTPGKRAAGQVTGPVTVHGVARVPPPVPWLAPAPDLDADLWFAVDLDAMRSAVGLPLAPLIVEADATPNPGGLPLGGQTRVNLPNNHLSYAITWFSLAVAVVVIYVVYARRRR